MTAAQQDNEGGPSIASRAALESRVASGSEASAFTTSSARIGHAFWRVVSRLVLIVVILEAYSWFRKTWFQRPDWIAYDHALDIIELQRLLGIAVTRVEIPLQQRMLEHPWLVEFFNAYYRQFKPALFICVALCLLLAPASFGRIFRIFVVVTLIALPMYTLYPLAPPRFMDAYGFSFVDTLAVYGTAPSSSMGLGGANQFAAMPSMHVGWSMIAAMWLAAALPRWRIGMILGIAHITLICVTVIVTGNHYVLDIVAGFGVAGAAVLVVRFFPQASFWLRWDALVRRRVPASSTNPVEI